MAELFKKVEEALSFIETFTNMKPEIGLILGSGLGSYADKLENKVTIPTDSIPYYPASTVEGHSGNLVFGTVGGTSVIAVQGRTHFYEGYHLDQVTFSQRIMQLLGVKKLVVTNAAGGVNPHFKPGDLMLITDHINFTGNNPLIGKNEERFGVRFPDMSAPYSEEYNALAESIALSYKFKLQRGVYFGVMGPSYETPAEIRMIRTLGGDAVGMSTVPDVIVASHAGMNVLGVSCITNFAAGISSEKLTHEDVTLVANQAKERFETLLTELIPKM